MKLLDRLAILFRKGRALVTPAPALDVVPSYEGCGIGMDTLINMLENNYEKPNPGDVVARLETCGMGVSIRSDTRYRITGPGPHEHSMIGTTADGKEDVLYPFYMRRHTNVPRFWVLIV